MKKLLIGILMIVISSNILNIGATIIKDISNDKITYNSNNNIDIYLENIVIESKDYNKNDVRLEKNYLNNDIVEVKIFDKRSNELLECITENKKSSNLKSEEKSHFIVSRERKDGPITTTLEVDIELYSSGSFRQINSINEVKIFSSSSNKTILENASAYATVPENKFPATQVDYSGSGVITGEISKPFHFDFSPNILKKAGFNVNQTNKTLYYSKYVSLTGVYKLYR